MGGVEKKQPWLHLLCFFAEEGNFLRDKRFLGHRGGRCRGSGSGLFVLSNDSHDDLPQASACSRLEQSGTLNLMPTDYHCARFMTRVLYSAPIRLGCYTCLSYPESVNKRGARGRAHGYGYNPRPTSNTWPPNGSTHVVFHLTSFIIRYVLKCFPYHSPIAPIPRPMHKPPLDFA